MRQLYMGELGDRVYLPSLIELLDDPLGARRAALECLPRVAGHDVVAEEGKAEASSEEKIDRWKRWYARDQIHAEPARAIRPQTARGRFSHLATLGRAATCGIRGAYGSLANSALGVLCWLVGPESLPHRDFKESCYAKRAANPTFDGRARYCRSHLRCAGQGSQHSLALRCSTSSKPD